MADYSPTIIAASLNDEELKKSIDGLVTYVNKKMGEIGTSIDNPIKDLEQKLRSLGNKNIDMGGSADGGSSRRAKKQNEEKQAVDGTTVSYQNLEVAKQKATGTSPAQDSYQEFVKNMRQNVALLAMEIKDMPNWSLDRQFGNYMQYERQIEQVRQRIQELKQELQNVGSDPNSSRLVIKQITDQIAQEQQKLVQLQREQITTTKQIELADKQALAQKQSQYETEKKALVDMSVGKREIVTFGERQASQEAKITEEIRKQIEAISNRKDATKAFEQISLMPQGSTEEISAKGKMLQQLLEKVRDTPFMSQTNIKLAERQLSSLVAQFRALKQEKERVANTQTTNASAEQKTEQELERERQSLEQVRQAQEARKQAIIDTGVAASQQTERMLTSIAEQQKSLDYTKQIEGVKELQVALRQMQNAYNTMDASDPMRDILRQRIETTKEAIAVAQRYNMVVAGIGGFGGNAPKDTIAAYSLEIQRLANIYKTLSVEERNAEAGKGLVNKYQELTKTVSDWQKQLKRPTSLSEAMKGDEKTIDDLAYKIQRLQLYKRGLDFTDPKQASEITQVDNKIKELEKDLQKYMGTTRQAQKENNALTRSWNYMKNRLAFYFTVGASTAFVKNLIEVRSQYEMNERALGILINSAERGTQIFKELSDMSLVSPYTLIELSSAAKQLTAYDIAAKDVVDTTRRLADMAAAVGIPIERLTYALGQIKAYGYLNSRDNRMFANAGIPLVKQLADYYTELEGRLVSTADVYDRIKKKAVGYSDVMSVINKMTDEGGKFFDFQAKMADTMKVQLANLTLAWNNMLNDIGEDSQGIITFGIKGLKQLFLQWRTLDEAIKNVAWTLGSLKAFQAIVMLFGGGLKNAEGWTLLLGKRLTDLGITAGKAFVTLATNPMTWVVAATYAIISLIRHIDQVKEAAREMNRELAKNAMDAADSLEKYLSTEAARNTRMSAKSGKLGETEANKAFADLREQIELSSDNANVLIADLLKIGDANERLSKAFDIADKIKEATSLLSGLNEEAFKVSQNNWLSIGEGLAEDLEDYVPQEFSTGGVFGKVNQRDKHEAEREMEILADDLAQVLRDRLGASINDPVVLGEAIERFRKAIKDKNPQLRDEVAQWFDIRLDQLLAERFEKATIASTSINRQFLTILKRDYESAFTDVTDNILKENSKWEKAQETAIKKAAEELKKTTVPAFHSAIDEMVKYMNSQDWRIRIFTVMGGKDRSDFQKEFDERVAKDLGSANVDYKKYAPKGDEGLSEWAKSNLESISKLKKEREAYERDNSEYSKKEKQRIDDEIRDRENLQKVFNQPTSTKEDIKQRKQAESELQKALKEELSLIDKVRSNYKKLTKDGYDSTTALAEATSDYNETVKRINSVLKKYGVGELKLEDYAGAANPQAFMNMLQKQLDALSRSGLVKTSEIKDLQVKLNDLKIESLSFNQKTLTDSLNNELGKLKDEYELAVELDANPELGGVFADMMGLSSEELEKLPRDFEGVVRKLQTIVDEQLGMGAFDVRSNLNKDVFDEWVKANKYSQDSELVAKLKAITDYANKVRQDETKKQVEDWNKLLEKYAEYEYKRNQIIQQAERERETARKKGAGDDVHRAINIREQRELAKLDFEQFQRSPEWITATGDLATLTDKALSTLINDLEEYKKKAKNLDPKQIKQLNDALKKLRNQQRQGNPFLAIKRAFEEAAEKAAPFNQEVKELTERWMELKRKQSQSDEGVFLTKDEQKELDELPEKIDIAQKKANEAGKVSAQAMVAAINEMLQPINTVTGAISEMFSAFGNTEAAETIGKVTSMLDKAASFAAMGAQIGGGWGAAIGGVIGLLVGGITAWADEISGNADITRAVERSERVVKRLEISYKDLEKQVEKTYGVEEYAAIKIEQANKRAQLAELKRQLQLEESRNSKNRDKDKILDLQNQIKELEYDIHDSLDNITNDFLGISSIGDAVENMVGSIIDALRNGEDAMDTFDESIDDMIANMVKKVYANKVLSTWFEEMWGQVNDDVRKRTAGYEADLSRIWQLRNNLAEIDEWGSEEYSAIYSLVGEFIKKYNTDVRDESWQLPKWEEFLKQQIKDASKITIDDVKKYAEILTAGKPILEGELDSMKELLNGLGLMKDTANEKLSNLQQGISSVTEDTAGALEAMLNGISQQSYLQSDLLVQIRDAVVNFNMDERLGTQGLILLELQNSYQVQQSIQGILQGVLNPSGRAFMVEME